MSLVLAVLLAALVLGWAGGGSLGRLGELPLRRPGLVVAALAAQLAGALLGGPFFAGGLLLSAVLLVRFLSRNRGIAGTGLVALGLLANVLVVGVNGAMPVSPDAAARAGVSTQDLLTGADARHQLADDGTRLPWLGDVVPVPLPVRPQVISAGDVLVAAGLGQLVVVGMLGRGQPGVTDGTGWQRGGWQRRAAGDTGGRRQRRALPPLPPLPPRPAGAPAAAPVPGARTATPVRRRSLPPRPRRTGAGSS